MKSEMLERLDKQLVKNASQKNAKQNVAIIMGGYSTERHISVESGRNIFEKLSSSGKYQPIPVFLTGKDGDHHLYVLPINVMLKDNADDIKAKVMKSDDIYSTEMRHATYAIAIKKVLFTTPTTSSTTLEESVGNVEEMIPMFNDKIEILNTLKSFDTDVIGDFLKDQETFGYELDYYLFINIVLLFITNS